jgi:hypothetical protein
VSVRLSVLATDSHEDAISSRLPRVVLERRDAHSLSDIPQISRLVRFVVEAGAEIRTRADRRQVQVRGKKVGHSEGGRSWRPPPQVRPRSRPRAVFLAVRSFGSFSGLLKRRRAGSCGVCFGLRWSRTETPVSDVDESTRGVRVLTGNARQHRNNSLGVDPLKPKPLVVRFQLQRAACQHALTLALRFRGDTSGSLSLSLHANTGALKGVLSESETRET